MWLVVPTGRCVYRMLNDFQHTFQNKRASSMQREGGTELAQVWGPWVKRHLWPFSLPTASPGNMPPGFWVFCQLLCNHAHLRVKIYLSAGPARYQSRREVLCPLLAVLITVFLSWFKGCQHSPPTHTSQLSATLQCLMGSVEGLTGTPLIRTGARKGWGEKSAVGVGREVSERSWSLQLLAESGSEIILCRSCIYYLDYCSSFPLKPTCQ